MHQGRAVEVDAIARQHLRLPVQRKVPSKFRGRDVRKQCRRRQSALDRTGWRGRLHDGALAGTTAIAGPTDPLDPEDRRHDVEHLADVLADTMQPAPAVGTGVDRRLDDDLFARKMLGQTADVARCRRAAGLISRNWLCGRPLRFDRCRRCILDAERQLRRIGLASLGAGAEECPLQRVQHRLQPVILVTQIGDDSNELINVAGQRSDIDRHDRKVPNRAGVSPGLRWRLGFIRPPSALRANQAASSPCR
jgi:hypothetical protein